MRACDGNSNTTARGSESLFYGDHNRLVSWSGAFGMSNASYQHNARGERVMKTSLTALSANALARALAVPAPRINDLARERRGIRADTALRLAHHFGTTPQFWLNLQATNDLCVAGIASGQRIRREARVMSTAA